MSTKRLLRIAALAEGLTGVALLAVPATVTRLLLGAEIAGLGVLLGRLCGFALLALALACWPVESHGEKRQAIVIFAYGALVAIYLTWAGVRGEAFGILLWPAIGWHAALTIWILASRRPETN